MYTTYLCKLRRHLENMLTLPERFFIKNDTSFCILYEFDGKTECLYAHTKVEAAELLKKHGLIHYYSCQGSEIVMFEKILITITGDKGQPIQQERLITVRWDDFDITPGQAITIAAANELQKNNVVTKFIKSVFKAA